MFIRSKIHLLIIGLLTTKENHLMSIIEKLTNMKLPEDTTVSLTLSDGCDVFVHNETDVDTALANTGVVNGFSDLMVAVFGKKGKHTRAAVGMGSLPFNIAVEIDMIVEIE